MLQDRPEEKEKFNFRTVQLEIGHWKAYDSWSSIAGPRKLSHPHKRSIHFDLIRLRKDSRRSTTRSLGCRAFPNLAIFAHTTHSDNTVGICAHVLRNALFKLTTTTSSRSSSEKKSSKHVFRLAASVERGVPVFSNQWLAISLKIIFWFRELINEPHDKLTTAFP
jgi:hypothetical protein